MQRHRRTQLGVGFEKEADVTMGGGKVDQGHQIDAVKITEPGRRLGRNKARLEDGFAAANGRSVGDLNFPAFHSQFGCRPEGLERCGHGCFVDGRGCPVLQRIQRLGAIGPERAPVAACRLREVSAQVQGRRHKANHESRHERAQNSHAEYTQVDAYRGDTGQLRRQVASEHVDAACATRS